MNDVGCMIVELLDYRPPRGKDPVLEKPECTRVVLSPNGESLWSDICLLNQKAGGVWTDAETLEVEAQILVRLDFISVLPFVLSHGVAGYFSAALS